MILSKTCLARHISQGLVLLVFLIHLQIARGQARLPSPDYLQRPVTLLVKEVPAWRPMNGCFSCHNNGDGARALFIATQAKIPVEPGALTETIEFLKQPHLWDKNGPDGEFNDRQLARLQFASALATAVQVGMVQDRQPLIAAAERLAADQHESGVWIFSGEDTIGSPVTYGRPLATATALQVLRQADAQRFAKTIAAAERWLINFDVQSVLNAAAVLQGIHGSTALESAEQRKRCLELIRQGQTQDGGWGPYLNSPPEAFDTAMVLLALARLKNADWAQPIKNGRQFLIQTQLKNGGWSETTRPSGRESYAQWIATTAWATLALIATNEN